RPVRVRSDPCLSTGCATVAPVSAVSGHPRPPGPRRVIRFLCLRMAHAVVVLAGVSLLTFVFAALAPGDVLSEMKIDPQVSPETVATLRLRYGLDRPFSLKFGQWLQSIRRGELGFSLAYNRPVATLLWPRARNTLLLTVSATTLAWLIAVPVGAWSASHRG